VNFDGDSKGNIGPTRFKVVYRDKNGEIIHIMEGSLG